MHVDPVVGKAALGRQHQRNGEEVAVAKVAGGLADLVGCRRVHHLERSSESGIDEIRWSKGQLTVAPSPPTGPPTPVGAACDRVTAVTALAPDRRIDSSRVPNNTFEPWSSTNARACSHIIPGPRRG